LAVYKQFINEISCEGTFFSLKFNIIPVCDSKVTRVYTHQSWCSDVCKDLITLT